MTTGFRPLCDDDVRTNIELARECTIAGANPFRQIIALGGEEATISDATRRAVELASNLPTVEKYLITASHAHIARDYQKAIESYGNLAKVSPDNTDVQLALAHSYEDANDFPSPDVLITSIIEDLQAAIEQLSTITEENGNGSVAEIGK